MCGVRYARVATKSKREDGGDGARRRLKKKRRHRCLLIRSATRRDAVVVAFRKPFAFSSRRRENVGENVARVSETFRPRASLETYRHGPASVPREDPAHALGHRLARPEVLLDAGPGRLSRARDARAIHRDAHAVRAERRRATPRRIPPRRLTPRRTKWRDLGTQQVSVPRRETKEDCVDHSGRPGHGGGLKNHEADKKAVAKNGSFVRVGRCRTHIPKKRRSPPEDAV